jgi:hypothetical protein
MGLQSLLGANSSTAFAGGAEPSHNKVAIAAPMQA